MTSEFTEQEQETAATVEDLPSVAAATEGNVRGSEPRVEAWGLERGVEKLAKNQAAAVKPPGNHMSAGNQVS